jgi:hypothetical protein
MAKKAGDPVKRFVVTVEVEGARVDADTPISRQALIDLFELQFSSPKGIKILKIDAQEKP